MMQRAFGDDRKVLPSSVWTGEREATLREMWATGKSSASQIAVHLGLGLEGRNAVIGKIHRLGLTRNQTDRQAALRNGQAKGAATKRAKSEQQRVVSTQALAEHLKQQADTEHAAVPKIAVAHARRNKPPALTGHALAERKARNMSVQKAAIAKVELRLIANPAFVKVEREPDFYAHMRSERGLIDAMAALSR